MYKQKSLYLSWLTLESCEKGYLMTFLLLVTSIAPLCNGYPMEYDNSKIRIQQKNLVRSNCSYIQENWLWPWLKWIGYKWRLNHHNCIGYILSVQHHPKICSFIRTVIKNLHKKKIINIQRCKPFIFKALLNEKKVNTLPEQIENASN